MVKNQNTLKTFMLEGVELLEKTAKPFGQNSAHVGVPASWVGDRVAIIRLDSTRKQ